MAIGLLIRTDQMNVQASPNTGFIGELSLNACIRPVSGILPMAIKAKETHIDRLIIAVENVEQARMVKGIEIVGCSTLRDTVHLLEGKPVTPSTNYPPSPHQESRKLFYRFLRGKRP